MNKTEEIIVESLVARVEQLNAKIDELEKLAAKRKTRIMDLRVYVNNTLSAIPVDNHYRTRGAALLEVRDD